MADGDRRMVSSLKRSLSEGGYVVDVALNGEHALWHATEFEYDAVVLESTLASLDGVQVARRLRERKPSTPILMLVARTDLVPGSHDHGSRAVADAYLVKPFQFTALTGQLSALTQVGADKRPPELRVGELRMRSATRQAWRADSELNLSPREFTLLGLFLAHSGQVLTRRQILDHVWGGSYDKAPNLVDQYVLYLRRKVDRPFAVHQIETVRGEGYRLRELPLPAV